MQVVVNIDDNLYTRLFDNGGNNVMDMRRACVAIRKGTVLPKGHGDLKDADALNEAYTYECISECDRCEHCSKDGHGCELLLNAPTIIEADRSVESEEK